MLYVSFSICCSCLNFCMAKTSKATTETLAIHSILCCLWQPKDTYRGALGQPRMPSDTVLNHPLKSPGVAEDT